MAMPFLDLKNLIGFISKNKMAMPFVLLKPTFSR
jgi:hypothetical protein